MNKYKNNNKKNLENKIKIRKKKEANKLNKKMIINNKIKLMKMN
jgi:hypothetical protein